MSDLAVGKNGMPTYQSPVKILRPGDPDFPADAGQYPPPETTAKVERTEPMADKTLCMFHGCKNPKPPGMGRRYCAEHSDPAVRQKAAHRPAGKKPTTVAKAIAKLRAKEGEASPATAAVPPAPARKASDPDLYQQLTARRAQMVADIEAIGRVLAII